MPASISIEYRGFIPKMPKRHQNNIMRDSYEELGNHFFENNLPRRFTVQGGKTLGYSQRTPQHRATKRRLFGHNLPFVFKGITRQRALSALTRVVARAKKGVGSAELRVNAPTLNFHPNLREEFERIANREIGPLERKLESSATKKFNDYEQSQSFKA